MLAGIEFDQLVHGTETNGTGHGQDNTYHGQNNQPDRIESAAHGKKEKKQPQSQSDKPVLYTFISRHDYYPKNGLKTAY